MVCHYYKDRHEFGCKIRTFYRSFKNLDEVARLIVFDRDKWSLVSHKQTVKDIGKQGEYILYLKMNSLREKHTKLR